MRKIGISFLDMLFPLFCLGCGAHGKYLCDSCLEIFPRRLKQRCPTCLKKITPHGEACFDCSYKNALDGLFAASLYRSPLVSASIHTFKYNFIPSLALPLGSLLAERIIEIDLPLPDICIPVPLHSKRLRFRGFNQSELLAEAFVNALTPGLDIPLLKNSLLRTRYTKPQMKTHTKEERLKNLTAAFTCTKEAISLLQGKSIWLIDDVSTTGTTLEECALALKNAGAKNVFGIVLAR
ncbi:MAG: ComF family protein [Candidatus Moraniibacteriota bacterium]